MSCGPGRGYCTSRRASRKSGGLSSTQLTADALAWSYASRLAVVPDAGAPLAAKISDQPRDLRFPGAIAQLEEHLLCKHPPATDAAKRA
jgi:hypothetical protein